MLLTEGFISLLLLWCTHRSRLHSAKLLFLSFPSFDVLNGFTSLAVVLLLLLLPGVFFLPPATSFCPLPLLWLLQLYYWNIYRRTSLTVSRQYGTQFNDDIRDHHVFSKCVLQVSFFRTSSESRGCFISCMALLVVGLSDKHTEGDTRLDESCGSTYKWSGAYSSALETSCGRACILDFVNHQWYEHNHQFWL